MMNWDVNAWMAFVALLLSAASAAGVLAFYVIRNTSKDEADDAVKELETEKLAPLKATVIEHDRRIIAIERDISALPQVNQVSSLNDKISDIAGDVKALGAEIRSLHQGQDRTERALQLVTESLMTPKS
jgi:hypothetical protein